MNLTRFPQKNKYHHINRFLNTQYYDNIYISMKGAVYDEKTTFVYRRNVLWKTIGD